MSKTDILGMLLIIVCIVLLSLTKEQPKPKKLVVVQDENLGLYKVLTIVFALCCGLMFTINSIDVNRVLKLGFTPW